MSDEHSIEPFRIDVPEEVLADLRERLARTRFPDEVNDAAWSYGMDLATLKDLCRYWAEEYDWRAEEARLNALPQFTTRIDGLRVHFVHAPSPHANALPLVLTHGWPGSFAEFSEVVERLREPVAHGGDARDAFHVICPSIPGYGFSEASPRPGMTPARVASMWLRLLDRLGYDRFGAQGGDWGASISEELARCAPERCAGLHLNMVLAGPPRDRDDPMEGVTDLEKQRLGESRARSYELTGYQHQQATRPQTLGIGLNDSPAGLASWILEKFHAWSDCDGDLLRSFTREQLLTNIMLYWVPQAATSSARLYYETQHRPQDERGTRERVDVPTGAALFPKELIRAPRAWAEARFRIVHWNEMPKGGHFAAMEVPELLLDDVRSFFRPLRA